MVTKKDKQAGMTLIVKVITRLTVGLILLYGIYIVLHGHISPGGGFAGGVIVALSFIHIMLAFGKDEALKRVSWKVVSSGESIGALLFFLIASLGAIGGYFFYDWFPSKGEAFRLFSAGTVPLSNVSIGIKVGMGLFAIFIVLVMLKFKKQEKK